jgi:hypothetical protein
VRGGGEVKQVAVWEQCWTAQLTPQAVEPTLEDSHIWFMRDRQATRKVALA